MEDRNSNNVDREGKDNGPMEIPPITCLEQNLNRG